MKAIVAVSTFLLCTTVSMAADLAPQSVEPAAPMAAAYDWSGPYLGLHAGYGWGREHDNQSRLFPATGEVDPGTGGGGIDRFNVDGFVGGAHAGYNYQIDQFVLGVEGDIDYADIKGGGSAIYPGDNARSLELKSEWQGSARLRAGYAIDNLLLYATGGIAFADGKLTTAGVSSSKTHIGWTAGIGAEYAFTQNWIGRVEARYSDFSKETYRTPDGRVKSDWDQTTVTAGVSYKF